MTNDYLAAWIGFLILALVLGGILLNVGDYTASEIETDPRTVLVVTLAFAFINQVTGSMVERLVARTHAGGVRRSMLVTAVVSLISSTLLPLLFVAFTTDSALDADVTRTYFLSLEALLVYLALRCFVAWRRT